MMRWLWRALMAVACIAGVAQGGSLLLFAVVALALQAWQLKDVL